jgi:hypothetical protein
MIDKILLIGIMQSWDHLYGWWWKGCLNIATSRMHDVNDSAHPSESNDHQIAASGRENCSHKHKLLIFSPRVKFSMSNFGSVLDSKR